MPRAPVKGRAFIGESACAASRPRHSIPPLPFVRYRRCPMAGGSLLKFGVVRFDLGRRVGGRSVPAVWQIGMICLWHIFVPRATVLLDGYGRAGSAFLVYPSSGHGYCRGRLGGIEAFTVDTRGSIPGAGCPSAGSSAVEALGGSLVLRTIVRRPRPRWYHFCGTGGKLVCTALHFLPPPSSC